MQTERPQDQTHMQEEHGQEGEDENAVRIQGSVCSFMRKNESAVALSMLTLSLLNDGETKMHPLRFCLVSKLIRHTYVEHQIKDDLAPKLKEYFYLVIHERCNC